MAELAVRETIRNRLNADKIKLWLEPYTLNDGQRGEAVAVGYFRSLINYYY